MQLSWLSCARLSVALLAAQRGAVHLQVVAWWVQSVAAAAVALVRLVAPQLEGRCMGPVISVCPTATTLTQSCICRRATGQRRLTFLAASRCETHSLISFERIETSALRLLLSQGSRCGRSCRLEQQRWLSCLCLQTCSGLLGCFCTSCAFLLSMMRCWAAELTVAMLLSALQWPSAVLPALAGQQIAVQAVGVAARALAREVKVEAKVKQTVDLQLQQLTATASWQRCSGYLVA